MPGIRPPEDDWDRFVREKEEADPWRALEEWRPPYLEGLRPIWRDVVEATLTNEISGHYEVTMSCGHTCRGCRAERPTKWRCLSCEDAAKVAARAAEWNEWRMKRKDGSR